MEVMMFRNQMECYQAIGVTLPKAVPEPWTKITVETKLDGSPVDQSAAYPRKLNRATCDIAGVTMLARYFYELAKLISTPERAFSKHVNSRFSIMASTMRSSPTNKVLLNSTFVPVAFGAGQCKLRYA